MITFLKKNWSWHCKQPIQASSARNACAVSGCLIAWRATAQLPVSPFLFKGFLARILSTQGFVLAMARRDRVCGASRFTNTFLTRALPSASVSLHSPSPRSPSALLPCRCVLVSRRCALVPPQCVHARCLHGASRFGHAVRRCINRLRRISCQCVRVRAMTPFVPKSTF